MKPIIFSGVQPSGNLHLGNYLGAISQWVEMQDQYNCIFCVVDYHAITVKQDPSELKNRIIDIAKIYLASGIDPKKSVIFQQSHVRAHTELAWILNCTSARIADMNKMTQFKDKAGIRTDESFYTEMQNYVNVLEKLQKSGKKELAALENINELLKKINNLLKDAKQKKIPNYYKQEIGELENKIGTYKSIEEDAQTEKDKIFYNALEKYKNYLLEQSKKENVSVGLYDYPVLMAADILLYNADLVPVGDDQVQHVELCRTLASRFNQSFGEAFKIPAVKIRKEGARIMGLDDPMKKMSKSAMSAANYIALNDKVEDAKKKIMRATTDSESLVKFDKEKKPGISNLLTIYSLLTNKSIKELEKNYQGKGYGDFKKDLAEVVAEFLKNFQAKYNAISDTTVKKILKDGADSVRPIAEKTLEKVKENIGVI